MTPQESEFMNNSCTVRGTVIGYTIALERTMDSFIGSYFLNAKDKKAELIELIIADRMQFSYKVEVIAQILKKNFKDDKEFSKAFPKFNDELAKIGEVRNLFAHNMSLMPREEDYGVNEIVFLKYKNKAIKIAFTESEIKEITDRITKYLDLLVVEEAKLLDKARK